MAAVRHPFAPSCREAPPPCTEAAVAFCGPVPEEMPYGPLGLTGLRGPVGGVPNGPLALTVLGGPVAALPNGPLALTVLGGPVGGLPNGPFTPDGFVAGDATAEAGIARQSVQTLVAMRRVSMVTTFSGLENGACICRRGDDAPRQALARASGDRLSSGSATFANGGCTMCPGISVFLMDRPWDMPGTYG
jgi:hypothetical protein